MRKSRSLRNSLSRWTAAAALLLFSVFLPWLPDVLASDEQGETTRWPVEYVDWQRNGDWIVFSRSGQTANSSFIYKVRADGTGLTQLTFDGICTAPLWSPDGSRIGFHTITSTSDFWTMDANGGNYVSLGSHPGRVEMLSWCPDGTSIAINQTNENAAFNLRMNALSGEEGEILGGAGSADWHPSGRYLVVQRTFSDWNTETSGTNLYEIDLEDPSEDIDFRQITSGTHEDWYPRYSPDGNWIAFESFTRAGERADGNKLHLVQRDGTSLHPVVIGDPEGWSQTRPDFSPDGQRLVFARGLYAATDLYTCRLDGTDLQRLTYFYPEIGSAKGTAPRSQPQVIAKAGSSESRVLQPGRLKARIAVARPELIPGAPPAPRKRSPAQTGGVAVAIGVGTGSLALLLARLLILRRPGGA